MRTLKTFLGLIIILSVVFLWGCERKVVVEQPASDDGFGAEVSTCFGCHSDEDFKVIYAENQWETSKHGIGATVVRNRNAGSHYEVCEDCHTSEGFLRRITGMEFSTTNFTKIGCFTCHAPHTNKSLQLRTTAAVTLEDGATFDHGLGNLCANCHHSRANVTELVVAGVEMSTHWGSHHGPQSDMLAGTNGYEYAGYTYENSRHTIETTDGCPMCHFEGSIGTSIGGHTFRMEDEEAGLENTTGCNVPQCHSGTLTTIDVPAAEDFDHDGNIEAVQDEIEGLLETLAPLLEEAGLLEDGEPASVTVADAGMAGAVFNYIFVEEDKSMGIHNTRYAVGLLQSAIDYMNTVSLAAR
jgi:hypothetical protein